MQVTVIIPTMVKAPKELKLNIDRLSHQNCNIILIDNSANNLCNQWEGIPNIIIKYFPSNLGVNPAWNLGIEMTETRYYIILNDDCLVWNFLISKVEEILSRPSIGVLTFKTNTTITSEIYDSIYINQNNSSNLSLLGPDQADRHIGWIVCGKTSEYIEIPYNIKILYGDNFIYQTARKAGKKTVIDIGNIVFHKVSTTINAIFTPTSYHGLFASEGQEYAKIVSQYGLEGI